MGFMVTKMVEYWSSADYANHHPTKMETRVQSRHLLRGTEKQPPARCSSYPATETDSGPQVHSPGPPSGWRPSRDVTSVAPFETWSECRLQYSGHPAPGSVGSGSRAWGQGWSPSWTAVAGGHESGQKQGLWEPRSGAPAGGHHEQSTKELERCGVKGGEIPGNRCPEQRSSHAGDIEA